MKQIIFAGLVLLAACLVISYGCVSDCIGKEDGHYQSCIGCDVYASCVNGNLFDNRTCPGGLVWDDTLKYCNHTSSTCP